MRPTRALIPIAAIVVLLSACKDDKARSWIDRANTWADAMEAWAEDVKQDADMLNARICALEGVDPCPGPDTKPPPPPPNEWP